MTEKQEQATQLTEVNRLTQELAELDTKIYEAEAVLGGLKTTAQELRNRRRMVIDQPRWQLAALIQESGKSWEDFGPKATELAETSGDQQLLADIEFGNQLTPGQVVLTSGWDGSFLHTLTEPPTGKSTSVILPRGIFVSLSFEVWKRDEDDQPTTITICRTEDVVGREAIINALDAKTAEANLDAEDLEALARNYAALGEAAKAAKCLETSTDRIYQELLETLDKRECWDSDCEDYLAFLRQHSPDKFQKIYDEIAKNCYDHCDILDRSGSFSLDLVESLVHGEHPDYEEGLKENRWAFEALKTLYQRGEELAAQRAEKTSGEPKL